MDIGPNCPYWRRIHRKLVEGWWGKKEKEVFSDYFLRKFQDDSFKSDFERALFENDLSTEDQKKGILNEMLWYSNRMLSEFSTDRYRSNNLIQIMCLLLAAGADVNFHSEDISILHYVSQKTSKDYMEIMDILLSHPNIQVNIARIGFFTPLMLACQHGCFEAFSKLCKYPNIDFNCQDNGGGTALHHAFCEHPKMHLDGKMKIIEKIFDPDSTSFIDAVNIDSGDNVFETLLICSTFWCDFDWIWQLLLRNPVVRRMLNVRNRDGETLLFQAIRLKKLNIACFLLQHSDLSLRDLLDAEDRSVVQFAVDHWIAEGGGVEGVEECLQVFREHPTVRRMLNTKNKEGDPPVIQLLKHGRVGLVNILLESPDIDLDLCDSAGENLETIAR